MTALPDSIGDLTELTSLYLYDNYNLKDLPETLGNLSKLELLIVVGHSIPKGRQKEIEKLIPNCTVKF
jgi:Leucine-rich repeat (LRR) protein